MVQRLAVAAGFFLLFFPWCCAQGGRFGPDPTHRHDQPIRRRGRPTVPARSVRGEMGIENDSALPSDEHSGQ